jgi:signal transduction histidine kinase
VAPPRPAPRPVPAAATAAPRWIAALLRVPLAGKIVGANALIVVAAVGASVWLHRGATHDVGVMAVAALALVVSAAANLALVVTALRPLGDLERTATRVWEGDLAARVIPSPISDRRMQRVGSTLNMLLDQLTADRARARALAAETIRAAEAERAYIARELHDSTAQSLAALALQLGAAARDCDDPAASARLAEARALAGVVLEEVRVLSQVVHPRVLDDLGLAAALRHLARESGAAAGQAELEVVAVPEAGEDRRVPPVVASVLYRVAQESVANALRHGSASRVELGLEVTRDAATLRVDDDGVGFDAAEAEARRPGMGLFVMRERLSLVDGTFEVHSVVGRGTRVRATVPIVAPSGESA